MKCSEQPDCLLRDTEADSASAGLTAIHNRQCRINLGTPQACKCRPSTHIFSESYRAHLKFGPTDTHLCNEHNSHRKSAA